jgi:general secretion pathway protein A
MFLEYYGLREQPFGVTSDPRYLYFSETHREALGSLFYGIESGCGFLTLIAPPGLGKTTLLAQLLERLRRTAQTAFLFHTQCDSREFLSQLLSDLGLHSDDQNLARMYEAIHSVLLRNARTGRRFVLAIDEAQNLADSVLETVRLLSDFETPQTKLMQIVLCGQPQLADRLAHPDLIQLRQRISIVSKLQPLNNLETLMYIEHRMVVAGHAGPSPFSYDAVNLITAHSAGIPRNINNVCFNALTLGYSKRQKQIDVSTVREVLADLDLEALSSNNSKLTADSTSDSLFSLGELEPTNEQSYREFHAAVRAAWGTDAGNTTDVPYSEGEPQLIGERTHNLGDASYAQNIPLQAVPESQHPRSNIAAKLAATLDSVLAPRAIAPRQDMPVRPTTPLAYAETQSEKRFAAAAAEVKAPSKFVEPAQCELNVPHIEAEAPASAINADPLILSDTSLGNLEELRDAVLTNCSNALKDDVEETHSENGPQPTISASERKPSKTGSQRRIPGPLTPESQVTKQLGLTEVLTTYFGSPLTSRIVRPVPPIQDGTTSATLEA